MPALQESRYDAVVADSYPMKGRGQMLEIIQQLREISLHPLRPNEVEADVYLTTSARFQSLLIILDEVNRKKEKALIFLDRNIVEAYLARLLQNRYSLNRLPSIINGEVNPKRRQSLVDEFQNRSGFDVMLLSPKAGGVGLTLKAANHVIHLSRWWIPAVEDQSTDRAYRIGQTKPVHVYYSQATLEGRPEQSFDERLHALLQRNADSVEIFSTHSEVSRATQRLS